MLDPKKFGPKQTQLNCNNLLLWLRRRIMDEMSSYSKLQDFDWSMRLVLTSDQITSLRKPILLVSFTTVTSDGMKKEQIVEMSADEANAFVEKLKQCQAAMKLIS